MVKRLVNKLDQLSTKPIVITKQLLIEELDNFKELEEDFTKSTPFKTGIKSFQPYAKDVKSEIKIIADPKAQIDMKGKTDDFLKYFRNRYKRIERILKERADVRDVISISDALKVSINEEVKIIGIVTQKRERKNTILLQIEDLTSTATVFISPKTNRSVVDEAESILCDQVICVLVKKSKNDLFIAQKLILPDIPKRVTQRSSENICAVLISDLHVGSKTFLKKEFSRFISWINGEIGNNNQRVLAGRVKYVIIAGDLVDGIGVYPNQERELSINNIYEQYEIVARFLEQIPEYVDIIVIPGNHDATRQALPQPAIPKKYVEPLINLDNLILLGNPARIQLHGVSILVYHGQSLDDIIGSVPKITYQNLDRSISKAMKLLLRSRHLAPVYGNKTSLAPESKDQLIIENVPDILHMGHVHVFGYENYRGTLIINSGTWQTQTDYQRKKDVTPTPAIAPIINLKTFELFPKMFF